MIGPNSGEPVIIGVTGHRDIAPDAVGAVRRAVTTVFANLQSALGDRLQVASALADGADQLSADEALALGLRLIAVSPMPLDRYRATIRERDTFDSQWGGAAVRLELPQLCEPTTPGYAALHYERLGAALSQCSDLLLALWDGLPDGARGGTADVVRRRWAGQTGAPECDDMLLLVGRSSAPDLGAARPILQIATPRIGTAGIISVPGRPDARAGDCFLLLAAGDSHNPSRVPVNPNDLLSGLAAAGVTFARRS